MSTDYYFQWSERLVHRGNAEKVTQRNKMREPLIKVNKMVSPQQNIRRSSDYYFRKTIKLKSITKFGGQSTRRKQASAKKIVNYFNKNSMEEYYCSDNILLKSKQPKINNNQEENVYKRPRIFSNVNQDMVKEIHLGQVIDSRVIDAYEDEKNLQIVQGMKQQCMLQNIISMRKQHLDQKATECMRQSKKQQKRILNGQSQINQGQISEIIQVKDDLLSRINARLQNVKRKDIKRQTACVNQEGPS